MLILSGDAGTGKTHLLCDVARHRVSAGLPTIMLMGQRFLTDEAPWQQARAHLDLPATTLDEFVGALEAAAQSASARALIFIDAINEGAGRRIWPPHLAAFVRALTRSPWIGVVLSVRSSYLDLLVPESLRRVATMVHHNGFADVTYDAVRSFFRHFHLELPSTPLVAPEFQNPLFLKTLCKGLEQQQERRLPRGFHGITRTFELYLSAVNAQLAKNLDINDKLPLVRDALQSVARRFLDVGRPWLALREVMAIVDAHLPDRTFENSLYRGLVVEGILVEEPYPQRNGPSDEYVFIAYERLADHLMAATLLEQHLDPKDPLAAFAPGAPLAFINGSTNAPPGLIEALCIRVPEIADCELPDLAEGLLQNPSFRDAFRQSIVWRAATAVSSRTRAILHTLMQNRHELDLTLEVLLTVAILESHPLNAGFLDELLRHDAMADRDSWWSTFLHRAFHGANAVVRLIDWASEVSPTDPISHETARLTAITLGWMLSTSNRFLRDRATKALVNFLAGRTSAAAVLLEQLSTVDDLYVVERVFAVIYGLVTQSFDKTEVRGLAQSVFDKVFRDGHPTPHILLRDYARGTIERAHQLDCAIGLDLGRARPPYKSGLPVVPSEEDLSAYKFNFEEGSFDSGSEIWARNRIIMSVMEDDFARYTIGTNFGPLSHHWLRLGTQEPRWERPISPQQRVRDLKDDFGEDEHEAWAAMVEAYAQLQESGHDHLDVDRGGIGDEERADGSGDADSGGEQNNTREQLEERLKAAIQDFDQKVTPGHKAAMESLADIQESAEDVAEPPRLELGFIQRYVLKRVFDLGWTVERFGRFDRWDVGPSGRDASKAERIGKKYQWIALHEILAHISDNFQYSPMYGPTGAADQFEGPWQLGVRDIDPTCTIRALPREETTDHAWWAGPVYDSWDPTASPSEWAQTITDIPSITDAILVTNPQDGSRWLNLHQVVSSQQPIPADQQEGDTERRQVHLSAIAYLIDVAEVDSFLAWIDEAPCPENSAPPVPQMLSVFLGEHGWAPAAKMFEEDLARDTRVATRDDGFSSKLRLPTVDYLAESGTSDCSIEDTFTLCLPTQWLISTLGLHWNGSHADFVDNAQTVVAFDPASHEPGPNALLLREETVRSQLSSQNLVLCWVVWGQKQTVPAFSDSGHYAPELGFSGGVVLNDGTPEGTLKFTLFDPSRDGAERYADLGRVEIPPS